jgi:hypothetical protein
VFPIWRESRGVFPVLSRPVDGGIHLVSALIHDKPGRFLPSSPMPEVVGWLGGKERAPSLGFAGGNIDWAQKLSGWTEGSFLGLGTHFPSSLSVSPPPPFRLQHDHSKKRSLGQTHPHLHMHVVVYVGCSNVCLWM